MDGEFRKELFMFVGLMLGFLVVGLLSGCTVELTHEWSGEDIPVTVEYPEYIVISGNMQIPSGDYQVEVE